MPPVLLTVISPWAVMFSSVNTVALAGVVLTNCTPVPAPLSCAEKNASWLPVPSNAAPAPEATPSRSAWTAPLSACNTAPVAFRATIWP